MRICTTTVIIVTHELDTLSFGNRTLSMSAGKLSENPLK